jgi:hypothetical protein
MHSQFRGYFISLLLMRRLQTLTYPPMPVLASMRRYALVPELLVERMPKPIARRLRPIQPLTDSRPLEKLLSLCQPLAVDFNCFSISR